MGAGEGEQEQIKEGGGSNNKPSWGGQKSKKRPDGGELFPAFSIGGGESCFLWATAMYVGQRWAEGGRGECGPRTFPTAMERRFSVSLLWHPTPGRNGGLAHSYFRDEDQWVEDPAKQVAEQKSAGHNVPSSRSFSPSF